MFFSFSPTEILYISNRVLLYVFRFSFCFCVNNGSEKKICSTRKLSKYIMLLPLTYKAMQRVPTDLNSSIIT